MKLSRLFTGLALTTTMALSVAANAQQIFEPAAHVKAKLDNMLKANATSLTYFKAPHDMIAIGVVSKDLKKHVFYSNADGDFLLSGMMLDTMTQTNFNSAFTNQLDITLPEEMTNGIESLHAVSEGVDSEQADVEIYAVVDHNCGFCHRLHKTVQQGMKDGIYGDVKINWAPVGFMGEDSVRKAHKILSQESNDVALDFFNQGMARQSVTTSAEEMLLASNKVKQNESFMRKYDFGGVPAVFVKTGDSWEVFRGLPPQTFFNKLAANAKSSTDASKVSE